MQTSLNEPTKTWESNNSHVDFLSTIHSPLDGIGEAGSVPEPGHVVRVAFGEWPRPQVTHPNSKSVHNFIRDLMNEGHGEAIATGRKKLAASFESLTLKSMRMERGWSQSDLAIAMETSQPNVARLEGGRQEPSLGTLRLLVRIFDVDLNTIGALFR